MRAFNTDQQRDGAAKRAAEDASSDHAASHAAMATYLQSLNGYTVKPGDTLFGIAKAALGDGNRWREIAELNSVSPDTLQPGQVLRMPAQANGPGAAPAKTDAAATQAEAAPAPEKARPAPEKAKAAPTPAQAAAPAEKTVEEAARAPLPAGAVSAGQVAAFTANWEGFRAQAYRDRGQWTIGYGTRIDGHATEKYGVKRGEPCSEPLARRMLQDDIKASMDVAREFCANFDALPADAQLIVVDLAYNLGDRGIFAFKNFRSALGAQDFKRAADELVNSAWYGQVGRRSEHHVSALRRLAK